MRIARAAAVAGLVLMALSACAPNMPYRTTLAHPGTDCRQSADGSVAAACRTSVHEHAPDYDLLFVEFDDQGLLYPESATGSRVAAGQIDLAMAGLERIVKQARSDGMGVSLFVFVHGWKHNAGAEDLHVVGFRRMLEQGAAIEQGNRTRKRVVGIYVSWRGLAEAVAPFSELSFWSRKFSAQHVAEGSARELFSRLKVFRCLGQSHSLGNGCATGGDPQLRVALVGHSFGGLILYNVSSDALIDAMVESRYGTGKAPVLAIADMVILLNPAFEATRYTPVHRIARRFSGYSRPILVSITTTADWATGKAFPIGRAVNTAFESVASDEEDQANNNTIGHVPRYITHRLSKSTLSSPECARWRLLQDVPPAERLAQVRVNHEAERRNDAAFFGSGRWRDQGWQRPFCGGTRLAHVQHSQSPIWNVETDADVMSGHNDINNPVIMDVLRQLLHDAQPGWTQAHD